ncbi:MAG: FtsX-like permease family protein [Saprospiraceae bacterium]|jgi:lipoprotein-releasing system permease protein|nr:FtsX-like permease family protein [Saprospiraceae bacterium]MDP4699946.1 FtsX-like permease family protein [Saprospiraceae bacterium]MDP4811924.1 FtsX-like permease family protein [Saprospiraceae bacterium]MDP4813872.1 FtsX-like permease family protein [Saprospiraceae bacterium]MDP4912808.1 FtsX-like permease family protein [Saprospiraceae bacterium]
MASYINYRISQIHLTSNIRQTIVAMLGVIFGISMYVFMTGFMTGVNNAQNDLAFSSLAHVRVYNDRPADNTNIVSKVFPSTVVNLRHPKIIKYTDGIKNSNVILDALKSQKDITGVTTQVNINVFFKNAGNKINGSVSGVDVVNENKVFNTSKYITEGNWNELKQRSDGIFVSVDLANNLSLKVSDNLNIFTSDGISKNYKVIGLFKTDVASIDKSKAYININAARQLIGANQSYVSDIQINIKDYNKTKNIINQITSIIPYKTESWQMANQQLAAGSSLRDIIAIAVSLVILLVAGFGIYNIMNMTINQKIREIAILKAMGFSGPDVTQIFLTQAIVIGIIGGFIGLGFGYLTANLVNKIPFELAGMSTLPMAYTLKDYILAFMFGLVTTFIAGYIPARKASKIDPVTILRG